MQADRFIRMPQTAWVYPLLAALFYVVASSLGFTGGLAPGLAGIVVAVLLIPVLFGAIFAAVYHAEVIAHRTGEPYGTLILTAAVTVIEVALIASVMMSGAESGPTLARDTVYAVVMIVCAGLAGICILVGGLRYREQSFRVPGASAYLTVLMVLATLTLILPNYTQNPSGPSYSQAQLVFVAVATLLLYGAFLYIQTVRHRDYFIVPALHHDWHFEPSPKRLAISGALLLLALVAIVMLSKKFAVIVELGRIAVGAPPQATGLVVAMLILLPEGIAAVQAADRVGQAFLGRDDAHAQGLQVAVEIVEAVDWALGQVRTGTVAAVTVDADFKAKTAGHGGFVADGDFSGRNVPADVGGIAGVDLPGAVLFKVAQEIFKRA